MPKPEDERPAPDQSIPASVPHLEPVDSVLAAKARSKAKRAEAKLAGSSKAKKPGGKTVARPEEPRVKPKPQPRRKRSSVVRDTGLEESSEFRRVASEAAALRATHDAAPAMSQIDTPISDLPEAELPVHAIQRLLNGAHRTPHAVLGAHPAQHEGQRGVVIRALFPRAVNVQVVLSDSVDEPLPMYDHHNGLHTLFVADHAMPLRYQLRIAQADGSSIDRDDPYRFLPTVGEVDLHLFGEGRHLRLWEKLGAHPRVMDGVAGTAFAVWAPNAIRVSLIGSFNAWDTRVHPMRALGSSGVWELFVPGVGANALYKFEIAGPTGALRVKSDPMAFEMEQTAGHASVVIATGLYQWNDGEWASRCSSMKCISRRGRACRKKTTVR
jgi:hypothetical protein